MSSLPLGSSQEINDIQYQIEVYTKKIEHEKINLKIETERYSNQLEVLLKLQNKKRVVKKKKSKTKDKYLPPHLRPLPTLKKENPLENPIVIIKEVNKKNYDSDRLNNEINKFLLNNDLLKEKIEMIRKEKAGAQIILDTISKKCHDIEVKLDVIAKSNRYALTDQNGKLVVRTNELNSVKNEKRNQNEMFIKNRDLLEEKYHDIISENIKREREHMKEVFKKANAHGVISIGKKNQDEMRKMENEDISDRTPILDLLIEKWKYFNKNMKIVLDKYARNAVALSEAFDKIIGYLGVESMQEIPKLLEKVETQMSNIEMFISQLTRETFSLQDKKQFLEYQIRDLMLKSKNSSNDKSTFISNKKDNIDMMNKKINKYKLSVVEKEQFFNEFKNSTDDFLLTMEKTFISEYVPYKTNINKEEWYNEENVTSKIATVNDYLYIIEEIEKAFAKYENKDSVSGNVNVNVNRKIDNKDVSQNVAINKDLEKLKFDMRSKIETLKVSSNMYSEMKERINFSLDDNIKKMADDLIEIANKSNK